jgi:hypothetical protein
MMWTEGKIAGILARNTFKNALCALPNSTWTGDEIDLLVVPPCLRVVDVEIKVSRADLRADRNKDRWWNRIRHGPPLPIAYPRHVWKSYFAMPAEIWDDKLLADVQPVSGVLVIHDSRGGHGLNGYAYGRVDCVKRAKPNRSAEKLDAQALRQIARLASLRMWDSYRDLDGEKAEHAKTRDALRATQSHVGARISLVEFPENREMFDAYGIGLGSPGVVVKCARDGWVYVRFDRRDLECWMTPSNVGLSP